MKFKNDTVENLNLQVSSDQLTKFENYYKFLIEYNQITNLTRITEKNDVYYKHFYDSLSITQCVDFKEINTLCDMGAGAGFPSIPLKILFPHLKVTIVDSLGKRITFLKKLIELLNLDDVQLVHDRVELFAKNHHNLFDLVTARAFGGLSEMIEMAIPMCKQKGLFVAMKSSEYQEEINRAKNALNILACQIIKVTTFDLPQNYGFRSIIAIQKNKHIQGYPRDYSQISKKPL
jgi:16S rRNA (guanine527-N7)-methyltransferase